MENRLEKRRPFYTGQLDFPLLFAIALLCAFGLVMLFSASYYYAQNTAATKYDGFFYLKSQAMYLAVGLVAMYVVSRGGITTFLIKSAFLRWLAHSR